MQASKRERERASGEINFFLQIKRRSEKLAATLRINQSLGRGKKGWRLAKMLSQISSSRTFLEAQGALKSNPNFYDPGHASWIMSTIA